MSGEHVEIETSGYGEFDYVNGDMYIGSWEIIDGVKKRHGHGKFIHCLNSASTSSRVNKKPPNVLSITNHSISGMLSPDVPPDEETIKPVVALHEDYEGEWHNDMMHGYGVYRYLSGAIYEGEWKENKQSGQGTYHFPNGAKYVGQWENHKMNGKGCYTDTDGATWEGIFIDGTFDSTIQKRLLTEFVEKQKVLELEALGVEVMSEVKKAFQGEKKGWKESFGKFLVTNPQEMDKFVSEPYARYEERTADKWNEIITQLLDVRPFVLRSKEQARILNPDKIFAQQLDGPGQVLEFQKMIDNRKIEVVMVLSEASRWLIVHSLDVVVK